MAEEVFSGMQIFQEPMCLISTSEDGTLQFETETIEQIKQIDKALVVVAITGLYRTGKSYLMNRLAGSSSGFPLGKTIEPKTKGIWVWCRDHPEMENTVLLLLDTEGLGDVNKGDSDHDNKIFTLASLLSNVLVYNMMTVFNQDAVEKLTFITEISKNIRFSNAGKADVSDEELGLILPTFVLTLRDFTLELEIDGTEVTPDEYLEECLKLKAGDGDFVEKYNRPRECIRKYFPKRKCFVFDRPGDRQTMKELEAIPFDELAESFIESTEIFLEYIYTCDPKVLISSKAVNGRMFVSLVEIYVDAIRKGAVPDVDDAIMVVAKLENERMASDAVKIFSENLEMIKLPILHTNNLDELYRDVQTAALEKFRMESMFDAEKFEKQVIAEMDRLWKRIKEENIRLVRKHCEGLLLDLHIEKVFDKTVHGEYNVAGGYMLYKLDVNAMKNEYLTKVKNIDQYEAGKVLMEFLESQTEFERDLMLEDKKMTDQDRKRELEKLQNEHKDAQESQQKLFQSKLDEERECAEEHRRKLEKKRKEYVRKQEEKMTAIMDEWDNQKKLSEKQIQMMREENEAQRKSFEDQISKMVKEHRRKEKENKVWFQNVLEEERVKARQQIDDVSRKFQNIIENERKRFANIEACLQMEEEYLREERQSRKRMEKKYMKKMESYENKIEDLIEKADDNDAKQKEEIERLKKERDEYKKKSEQSSCIVI